MRKRLKSAMSGAASTTNAARAIHQTAWWYQMPTFRLHRVEIRLVARHL